MKRIDVGTFHVYKPYDGYSIKTHGHTQWTISLSLFGWHFHALVGFDKVLTIPETGVKGSPL